MEDKQKQTDLNQLNNLSTFHYIVGALACAMSFLFLIYLGMGILFQVAPGSTPSDEVALKQVGIIFIIIGSVFFFLGQGVGVFIIFSGKYLKKQIKYQYSFIVACVECIFFPFGTALGIFTILVLNRPSVKILYGNVNAEK